jgi:hypothetical protein
MKRKMIKVSLIMIFPLVMIAIAYYSYTLQAAFYQGRTTYFEEPNTHFQEATPPLPIAFDPNIDDMDRYTDPAIDTIVIDSDGRPWGSGCYDPLGTYISICELVVLDGDTWVSYIPDNYALPSKITSLASDTDGDMWIGFDGSGLIKFDGENWLSFTTQNSDLASNDIALIAVDHLNRVWIVYDFAPQGTPPSGVAVFDGTSWTTLTTDNSGLIDDQVNTIAFDADNRAWLGTANGISVFDEHKWITYSQNNSGLLADGISDIAFDGEGRAWIGTYGKYNGVNVFD